MQLKLVWLVPLLFSLGSGRFHSTFLLRLRGLKPKLKLLFLASNVVTALQLLQEIGSLMALFWIAFNELRLFGIDRVHAQRAMSEFLVVLPLYYFKPVILICLESHLMQQTILF